MSHWIAEPDQLQQLAHTLRAQPAVALDTEFMRVNTFWPELALVQTVADGAKLIDPLAVDVGVLAPMLGAADCVKIMHSASEDLVALGRIGERSGAADAPLPIHNLFDTQVAASFAGLGPGLGYQRLVQALLGVTLAKSETRSNWLARPLSAEQIEYACADVLHLHELHQALIERLDARGFRTWCEAECAAIAQAAAERSLPENAHWEIRSAWRLVPEQQARLKYLLDWREHTARRIDRPRPWVLDNAVAAQLVEDPPQTIAALNARLTAQRSFPKRETQNLFDALHDPLPQDYAAVDPVPAPLRGEDEKRVDRIRERIAARATELDLPPALLGPRRLVEAYVRGGNAREPFAGWRAQALADCLAG
jgi:ribonuclease D